MTIFVFLSFRFCCTPSRKGVQTNNPEKLFNGCCGLYEIHFKHELNALNMHIIYAIKNFRETALDQKCDHSADFTLQGLASTNWVFIYGLIWWIECLSISII